MNETIRLLADIRQRVVKTVTLLTGAILCEQDEKRAELQKIVTKLKAVGFDVFTMKDEDFIRDPTLGDKITQSLDDIIAQVEALQAGKSG